MTEQKNVSDWDKRAAGWTLATENIGLNEYGPNAIIMKAANIRPGLKVLDVASGTGEPALVIANRVSPNGHVTAFDSSEEMLKTARERAANLKIKNIVFGSGFMDELPFKDATFDTLTCRFGFMFAHDPMATLGEFRRVLKPGGIVALMVHGSRKRNVQFDIVRRATLEFFSRKESLEPLRRFRFSGEGQLAALLEKAGFDDVMEWEEAETILKPAGEKFWTGMLQRTFSKELDRLSAESRRALDEKVKQALQSTLSNGFYHLLSTERVATGKA